MLQLLFWWQSNLCPLHSGMCLRSAESSLLCMRASSANLFQGNGSDSIICMQCCQCLPGLQIAPADTVYGLSRVRCVPEPATFKHVADIVGYAVGAATSMAATITIAYIIVKIFRKLGPPGEPPQALCLDLILRDKKAGLLHNCACEAGSILQFPWIICVTNGSWHGIPEACHVILWMF